MQLPRACTSGESAFAPTGTGQAATHAATSHSMRYSKASAQLSCDGSASAMQPAKSRRISCPLGARRIGDHSVLVSNPAKRVEHRSFLVSLCQLLHADTPDRKSVV